MLNFHTDPDSIMNTTKQHIFLAVIVMIAITGTAMAETANVFAADTPSAGDTATSTATVYNPDMTDWWADMIEHLGNESSTVWTEPAWGNEVWVEIEDIGEGTYRISLFGIAESGNSIQYTITETEDGYHKYGPALEDGTMDSRTYVTTVDSDDNVLLDQPIKPNWLILRDSRSGEGYIADSGRNCWLAPNESWFGGEVEDNWDGSLINYRANEDAYDNCSKPLVPDDVDLDWRNGSYNLHVTGTNIYGSLYFYTPDPDGTTTFQMRINWA